MFILLAIILSIFFIAMFVDRVLSEDKVKAWRATTWGAWESLGQIEFKEMVFKTNRWFLELFDLIYHNKMFSWKRVYRSMISSYLAVTVILFLFSVFTDEFISEINMKVFWAILIITGLFNLVPDFFSLQETRWVLNLSLKKKGRWLPIWFLVDFILTTLIFGAGLFLLIFIDTLIGDSPIQSMLGLVGERALLGKVNGPIFFACFLSTFVTSFLWFIFLFTTLFAFLLQKASPFLRTLLKVVAESDKPARITVGFLAVALIAGYGIVYLVRIFA